MDANRFCGDLLQVASYDIDAYAYEFVHAISTNIRVCSVQAHKEFSV